MDTSKVSASFRMFRGYRALASTVPPLSVGMAIFLTVPPASRGPGAPPLWFMALWILLAVVIAYLALFRFCYRIELADGALHWFTPLRSGWVSVAEVRGARPLLNYASRYWNFIEMIDLADGRPLLILVLSQIRNRRVGRYYETYEYSNRDDVVWFLYQLEKLTPNAPMRLERQR